jgi:hypothetical protein
MTIEIAAMQLAGAVQIVIAASNAAIPNILGYRHELRPLSPMIRSIFIVHSVYIAAVVAACGLLCLVFSDRLAAGGVLETSLVAFLVVFWCARILVQVFCYDHAVKHAHPRAGLAYLMGIFIVAAACLWVGTAHAVKAVS